MRRVSTFTALLVAATTLAAPAAPNEVPDTSKNPAGAASSANSPSDREFHAWAPTPPMGWNSWDCFAATVTEAQVKANADVMADKLKQFGWQYIVVDIQWYEPGATGFDYRTGAKLVLDEWGRLQPAVNRFPSAANGRGFKPLAEYVHSQGLKFGIHLMRGIPRQAVEQNLPIKGTRHTARDIADKNHVCAWNSDMFGIDMKRPGAQEYYNSVFELIASWDVDFIKVDDLSRPYDEHRLEIEAIRQAIDNTHRPMVLSTSPGETPVGEGAHVRQHANMWRISDDFWDRWDLLLAQFNRLDDWTPYRGPGHFPDADMLPLGAIRQVATSKEPGRTRFTQDEQRTMMSLWAIARSPLMMGGDLTKLDDFTLALLTNSEVLAVNQHSANNRQLFRQGHLIAWVADIPSSHDKYVALFNTSESAAPVSVDIAKVGIAKAVLIRDLWEKSSLFLPTSVNDFARVLPPHGSGLYRVSAQ